MKYYARQIAPENQTSPLDYIRPETWEEDYNIAGNSKYEEIVSLHFQAMIDNLPLVCDDLADYDDASEITDAEIIETVKRYFTQIDDGDALEIGKYLLESNDTEEGERCKVYSILTGTEYEYTTIRGCCQGEWNYLYYPAGMDRKSIEYIETEYFNTGLEFIVHDDDTAPETPEDITGYSIYIHETNNDDIMKELASEIGCQPEELVIYSIIGSHTILDYAEMK